MGIQDRFRGRVVIEDHDRSNGLADLSNYVTVDDLIDAFNNFDYESTYLSDYVTTQELTAFNYATVSQLPVPLIQEAGLWTPVFTFGTLGDLTLTYSAQSGEWVRIGGVVHITWQLNLATFTKTNASGKLRITGLPLPVASGKRAYGSVQFNGITKAGYTHLFPDLHDSVIEFNMGGSGMVLDTVVASWLPSGGNPRFDGSATYFV